MPITAPILTPEEARRIRDGVRLVALRELGDIDLAEEVAQETLVRLLEALEAGRLTAPERQGAFARGIARHVIVDVIRDRRRVVRLRDEGRETSDAGAENPLQALISAEEEARVRRALAELSDTDQEILRLSYREGLAPAEIADRLGEPGPRVRKRKSRAVERLRSAFRAAGHDSDRSSTGKRGEDWETGDDRESAWPRL